MKTSKDTTHIHTSGTDEPNWVKFKHRGLDCLILRHMGMGHLCGYVRLPISSPERKAVVNRRRLHTRSLPWNRGAVCRADGPDFSYLSVHGGTTFSGPLHRFYRGQRGVWLGFDCAHLNDVVPCMNGLSFDPCATYKDVGYVERECRALADQILGTITE